MKLVFGLGNPGLRYKYTRHNIGFLVVDAFAKKYHKGFKNDLRSKSKTAVIKIGQEYCILVKPSTFMNLSGAALCTHIKKHNLDHNDILVVCDDLNLDFGSLRIKSKGGSGGHKGLGSIVEHLKTDEFSRVKIGINRPNDSQGFSDYVLSVLEADERKELGHILDKAIDCCLEWFNNGIESAMNKFNN